MKALNTSEITIPGNQAFAGGAALPPVAAVGRYTASSPTAPSVPDRVPADITVSKWSKIQLNSAQLAALLPTPIATHINANGELAFWSLMHRDFENLRATNKVAFAALCGALVGGTAHQVNYKTGKHHPYRRYEHHMSPAACLCLFRAEFAARDTMAILTRATPQAIVDELVSRADKIFTKYRVIQGLTGLIEKFQASRRQNVDEVSLQRLKVRAAQCDSQLIAWYIKNYEQKRIPKNSHNAQSIRAKVNDHASEYPSDLKDVLAMVLNGTGDLSTNLTKILREIFASPLVANDAESHTLFASMMILALKKYGNHVKDHEKKNKERWATVLAFAFAIAGAAPMGGAAIAVAGLAVDKAIHKFWKDRDIDTLVESIIEHFRSEGSAVVKDRTGRVHNAAVATVTASNFEQHLNNSLGPVKTIAYSNEHWHFLKRRTGWLPGVGPKVVHTAAGDTSS